MWKMPEIILISRGNSELPIGLLLQVYSRVVYSVPHGTLSEGLRYPKLEDFTDYMLETWIDDDALFPSELWNHYANTEERVTITMKATIIVLHATHW
jgi:hypothetical protein